MVGEEDVDHRPVPVNAHRLCRWCFRPCFHYKQDATGTEAVSLELPKRWQRRALAHTMTKAPIRKKDVGHTVAVAALAVHENKRACWYSCSWLD